MPEPAERDDDLDGVADLADEAAADVRDSARWVRANLRALLTAFGVRDAEPSDPAGT